MKYAVQYAFAATFCDNPYHIHKYQTPYPSLETLQGHPWSPFKKTLHLNSSPPPTPHLDPNIFPYASSTSLHTSSRLTIKI